MRGEAFFIRTLRRGGGQTTSNQSVENGSAAGSSVRTNGIKKEDVTLPRHFDILKSEGSSARREEVRSDGGPLSQSMDTITGSTVYYTARSNGGFEANVPTETATDSEARLHVPEGYRSEEAQNGLLSAQKTHWVALLRDVAASEFNCSTRKNGR